ncbi:hypothetical protein PO124_15045 [Bacillus licheniformis]|nr:hypothetical protein [Bacillus licheniformis]
MELSKGVKYCGCCRGRLPVMSITFRTVIDRAPLYSFSVLYHLSLTNRNNSVLFGGKIHMATWD